MSPSGLTDLLIREGEDVRGLLPQGFSNALQGLPISQPASAADTRPIALGTVPERRSREWLWLIPLLLIPALLYWGYLRRNQTASEVTRVPETPKSVAVTPTPGKVAVNIPPGSVESQLLAFIQDPSRGIDRSLWINYDHLLFDTGSAMLRPDSGAQLRNVAAILTAYPNVHVKIGGYTDNIGNAQSNLKLSQDRANGVMAKFVTLGVSPTRMETQGTASNLRSAIIPLRKGARRTGVSR
jgi:OOP family OmpA-OmpF porin